MNESNPALRACPFCANEKLTIAYADSGRTIVVMCSECKAMGPRASHTDPTGHAELLWNSRYGVGIEHYRLQQWDAAVAALPRSS